MKSIDFVAWYEAQQAKVRIQIDGRLLKIQESGYFGHTRKLSNVLFEIKFNNGNRIYFTEITVSNRVVILILGGNKNGQEKDINKAQRQAAKIHGY